MAAQKSPHRQRKENNTGEIKLPDSNYTMKL